MSNDSFHYFPLLPPEIRIMIWEYCIPNRIAEFDPPWFLLDGYEIRQACYSGSTIGRNSRLPVLAAVNSESRSLVLERGEWYPCTEMDFPWLKNMWVQPRYDTLHLNSVQFCPIAAVNRFLQKGESGHSDSKWISSFLYGATKLGMRKISMTAERILPFQRNIWTHPHHLSGPADNWGFAHLYFPSKRELEDITKFAWHPPIPRVFHVAMAAVSLHVSMDAAVNSGLFGLLGDAPVQMIDVDANARLREFEEFFFSHALEREKEPRVAALFNLFRSCQFQDIVQKWAKEAEEIIMTEIWHSARRDGEVDVEEPDENHPFMKEVKRVTFRVRPQIMIRACHNQCYIREQLPKWFGELMTPRLPVPS